MARKNKWRLGCLTVLALFPLWLGVRWAGTYLTKTVAQEYKRYQYGVNTYFGYTVAKYRWQANGFEIRIRSGSTLDLRLAVPYRELVRIREQRWLLQDRVVLLRFDCVYHDSLDSTSDMAILYDFERGELHSYGGDWTVWKPEKRRDRYMSKEEFEALVNQLEATTTPVKH